MKTLTLYKISIAHIKLIKIWLAERPQKVIANVEFSPSNLFLMGRDGGSCNSLPWSNIIWYLSE